MTGTMAAPAPAAGSGQRAAGQLSIYMFSGTADKFMPMGVLAQAAAAMGMGVQVFVTGFALLGFTRERREPPFGSEFASMAPAFADGLAASHVPSWDVMLRQAKDLGARVYACSTMAAVLGIARDDLSDLVDDITGATSFLQLAEGGQTYFI